MNRVDALRQELTTGRPNTAVTESYGDFAVNMALVGITGGPGTGKSTVLQVLAEQGQRTLDADAVVHALYDRDEQVLWHLRRRWGQEVFDAQGHVNRPVLAAKVFENDQERQWLNSLVHPRVWQQITDTAQKAGTPLYCAIPLLFELGWQAWVTASVVVWANAQVRTGRLRRQRHWTAEQVRGRERAQMALPEKLQRADYAVINNGSRTLIPPQCDRLVHRIAARCACHNHATQCDP